MILFTHIPKTAGSTIFQLFLNNGYCCLPIDEKNKALEKQRGKKTLVIGHKGPGIRNMLKRVDFHFTILRHPVDLALSQYAFTQYYDVNKYICQNFPNTSFEEWFENYYPNNVQTSYFTNSDYVDGTLPEPELAKAISNLDKLDLVGITDLLDRFILLLKERRVLDSALYLNENPSTSKPELSSFQRSLVLSKNSLDYELYERYRGRLLKENLTIQTTSHNNDISCVRNIAGRNTKRMEQYLMNYRTLHKVIAGDVSELADSKIVVYGTGWIGSELLKRIPTNIIGGLDKERSDKTWSKFDTEVKHPDDMPTDWLGCDYVVVTPVWEFENIKKLLIKLGFRSEQIVDINFMIKRQASGD
jgi:hypothetical protein